MKVRPTGDKLLVRRAKAPETACQGRIILPEIAQKQQTTGEVLAVGPGLARGGELRPVDVRVGDVVLFGQYAGQEVTIDGEKLVVLREDDVTAVIAPGVKIER